MATDGHFFKINSTNYLYQSVFEIFRKINRSLETWLCSKISLFTLILRLSFNEQY